MWLCHPFLEKSADISYSSELINYAEAIALGQRYDFLNITEVTSKDMGKFRISLKFVPNSRIDNKPVSGQVIAWSRIGDRPLPEPMITQFTDAYI